MSYYISDTMSISSDPYVPDKLFGSDSILFLTRFKERNG